MTVTANIRPLSVGDYHQMVAAGILAPDERVELIEGQLFQMAAKGTLDSAAMTRIKRSLEAHLANRALVRYQDPIQLNETSEPEPDVAVVRADPWDYERHHPMPEDVFWIIEVADRSLTRDRDLKAPVYRRSGSREYWILDLTTPRSKDAGIPRRDLANFRQVGLIGEVKYASMGCRSFPLRLIAPFSASITQPDRYAHHPAITATRSRNAISRFRLLGFLRTRSESSRRWLALLSCKTILLHCALLPHESFFRPALKRRGYQTPEFFPCYRNRSELHPWRLKIAKWRSRIG